MNYRVIAGLFLLLFLGLADNQTIPALLPQLSSSLHTSVASTGLLVVFYSLAAALAAFLTGSLSDYYGRRRFLMAGAWFFMLASFGFLTKPGFCRAGFGASRHRTCCRDTLHLLHRLRGRLV